MDHSCTQTYQFEEMRAARPGAIEKAMESLPAAALAEPPAAAQLARPPPPTVGQAEEEGTKDLEEGSKDAEEGSNEETGGSTEEEFVIHTILKERKKRGHDSKEYLVTWIGYDDTTWQSEDSLKDTAALEAWEARAV